MITISIAKDFSRIPGARYPKEVILDGTAGLGTSFLEEAFGGLIRHDHISYEDICRTLVLVSAEDDDYIDEINEYLSAANEQKDNN